MLPAVWNKSLKHFSRMLLDFVYFNWGIHKLNYFFIPGFFVIVFIPWGGASWWLDIDGSPCSNWFGVENTGWFGIYKIQSYDFLVPNSTALIIFIFSLTWNLAIKMTYRNRILVCASSVQLSICITSGSCHCCDCAW